MLALNVANRAAVSAMASVERQACNAQQMAANRQNRVAGSVVDTTRLSVSSCGTSGMAVARVKAVRKPLIVLAAAKSNKIYRGCRSK